MGLKQVVQFYTGLCMLVWILQLYEKHRPTLAVGIRFDSVMYRSTYNPGFELWPWVLKVYALNVSKSQRMRLIYRRCPSCPITNVRSKIDSYIKHCQKY